MRDRFFELIKDFFGEFLEYIDGELIFEDNFFGSEMETNVRFEEGERICVESPLSCIIVKLIEEIIQEGVDLNGICFGVFP